MEAKKPAFGLKDCSPIEVASAMHSFSRDMQSYYKMVHGQLIDQLDEITDESELSKLKTDLQDVNQKMEYFHVLNNAASIVATLAHSPVMLEEFCPTK
ncbi:MAG: hypothetical protein HC800_12970 [Phormidesmis sp. RL_2_1]|nr:hypothetical protein [Phormidesmis sp. RL_2_1]